MSKSADTSSADAIVLAKTMLVQFLSILERVIARETGLDLKKETYSAHARVCAGETRHFSRCASNPDMNTDTVGLQSPGSVGCVFTGMWTPLW
jgi:hypothetical protein